MFGQTFKSSLNISACLVNCLKHIFERLECEGMEGLQHTETATRHVAWSNFDNMDLPQIWYLNNEINNHKTRHRNPLGSGHPTPPPKGAGVLGVQAGTHQRVIRVTDSQSAPQAAVHRVATAKVKCKKQYRRRKESKVRFQGRAATAKKKLTTSERQWRSRQTGPGTAPRCSLALTN